MKGTFDKNSENIIGSIKDCLADISDIGYLIQCGRDSSVRYDDNNSYGVRISKPPLTFGSDFQQHINQNNRHYPHNNEWGNYDGLENDLENFLIDVQNEYQRPRAYQPQRSIVSDMNRGMKTYMEIQKSLSFLCSYIPDMHDITIKSMSIKFSKDAMTESTRYHGKDGTNSFSISKNDFNTEPIYWQNRSSQGRGWISLFESKLYPGILDADIEHIEVIFEREIPESVKKMMSDILGDRHLPTYKESWLRKIIKRIKGV